MLRACPDNFGQPETASLRTLGNNLKRFLSFPWLFACFLFGFLPWSEVACNSKNVNWRVTQSGYQAVYGGVSSPFDTVATAKEAIDREVGENQKLLAKTLETERSGFLMSCSPHSLIFWEFGLAALLFISFIPLSGLRLTCCSAFAGMMLLMLVLELVVGSPLERRIDSIIHEQIRENPTAAMQAAMAVASGKTVWFWLVLTAAFFFGLSELLTNYLWKSYQSFSPAIPVFILISTVAFIIAGVSVQVSLWQNGITWMETRLASLHQIEQQKKNAQAEAEYRLEQGHGFSKDSTVKGQGMFAMLLVSQALKLFRKYGRAAKTVATGVLDVVAPGSGSLIELVGNVIDAVGEAADKEKHDNWEREVLERLQGNEAELARPASCSIAWPGRSPPSATRPPLLPTRPTTCPTSSPAPSPPIPPCPRSSTRLAASRSNSTSSTRT